MEKDYLEVDFLMTLIMSCRVISIQVEYFG